MSIMQIQTKYQTRTNVVDIEFSTYSDCLDFFNEISACEVTEIREYKHYEKKTIKDDGDYINYITIKIYDDKGRVNSVKIPKIKKTVTSDNILNFANTVLRIFGKKPEKILYSEVQK